MSFLFKIMVTCFFALDVMVGLLWDFKQFQDRRGWKRVGSGGYFANKSRSRLVLTGDLPRHSMSCFMCLSRVPLSTQYVNALAFS